MWKTLPPHVVNSTSVCALHAVHSRPGSLSLVDEGLRNGVPCLRKEVMTVEVLVVQEKRNFSHCLICSYRISRGVSQVFFEFFCLWLVSFKFMQGIHAKGFVIKVVSWCDAAAWLASLVLPLILFHNVFMQEKSIFIVVLICRGALCTLKHAVWLVNSCSCRYAYLTSCSLNFCISLVCPWPIQLYNEPVSFQFLSVCNFVCKAGPDIARGWTGHFEAAGESDEDCSHTFVDSLQCSICIIYPLIYVVVVSA